MKGTTNRKSRYFTLTAANHRAGPMLATKASTTKAGRKRICQPGGYRYQIINAIRIKKEMRKSANATTTEAVGTIILGKYTLLIRLELVMRLPDASDKPVEQNVHGNMPAKTIRAYGAPPSEGSLAIPPKMIVKTSIERSGQISAHEAPITVCL